MIVYKVNKKEAPRCETRGFFFACLPKKYGLIYKGRFGKCCTVFQGPLARLFWVCWGAFLSNAKKNVRKL